MHPMTDFSQDYRTHRNKISLENQIKSFAFQARGGWAGGAGGGGGGGGGGGTEGGKNSAGLRATAAIATGPFW